MANNFLKYTGLTFDEIVRQVKAKLQADQRFDNFRESAIAQTLIEIFAGAVDVTNYYLERRAEECFFDSAKLRSSVILLARSLGYSIIRPIPAQAKMKIKLKGNFRNIDGSNKVNIGDFIQVPYQSVFAYGGYNFILKHTMSIRVTEEMKNSMDILGDNYESDFIDVDYNGDDIYLVQGEIREKIIEGVTNPQIGSKFQIYRIEDTEFSNRYGSEDFDVPVTKVWVGNNKSDSNEYIIDRKSLLNWEIIEGTRLNTTKKVCLVRTAITEDIEVLFGDAKFAELGAQTHSNGAITTFDNIYIQYLATKGSKANQTGVINKKIIYSGKVYTPNGDDITSQVEFYFASNITGGADMEDIDSIRANAPAIYYTLDRLVTKKDYVNFLKTLTSPIAIKNAIAWGEQEEILFKRTLAIQKLFNVVFFSCLGDMYQTNTSPYYVKTKENGLDTAVLDENYDENEIAERNYFNVYVKQNVVEQLKEYETSAYHWNVAGDYINVDPLYFKNTYQNTMTLSAVYKTLDTDNAVAIRGVAEFTIDVSDLDESKTYFDVIDTICSRMQTALRGITDERGFSKVNANFGSLAFPNVQVNSIHVDNFAKIEIIHDSNDPCYVNSIEGDASQVLGLYEETIYKQYTIGGTSKTISGKILDVVSELDKRSQVTIRNIYISPLIENFYLSGTVYVNNLFDKLQIKTEVEDKIYNWLNINADFNQSIYLSNIVEIIENNTGVKYADVRFVSQELRNLNDPNYKFYNSATDPILSNVFGANSATVAGIINTKIGAFENATTDFNNMNASKSDEEISLEKNFRQFENYTYNWNVNITNRRFFEVLVKGVYDTLRGMNTEYRNFAESDDFIKLMSKIRKDYLKGIRNNMIDSKGNIATEETLSGKYFKGGYSLGNEIAKISVSLQYVYK